MKYQENLPTYCSLKRCDSSKVLCNTLAVAIEVSYRQYITASDPISINKYRSVWLSFVDTAEDVSHLGFNNECIEAAVARLHAAIVDAYVIVQQPVPVQIVLLLTRTLREDQRAIVIAA